MGSRQWIGSLEVNNNKSLYLLLVYPSIYPSIYPIIYLSGYLFIYPPLLQVSYVLDTLYNVPSKILHLQKGEELEGQLKALEEHFARRGAPVMMGGETDVSSKGIMGVCRGEEEAYLLVVVSGKRWKKANVDGKKCKVKKRRWDGFI